MWVLIGIISCVNACDSKTFLVHCIAEIHDNVPMLRHSDIWNAIDRLARDRGYSASGLARRAGLDPTTFNKSKRKSPDGKERWPSTESISKVLKVTGASLGEFFLTDE